MKKNLPIENWSSRYAFILATIGGAIGLGNIWKFPYTTGTNGGAAFIAIYLVALVFIAAPAFIAETVIGRLGKNSPPQSLKTLALKAGDNRKWSAFGWSSILCAVLVFSFYSVIAGWSLAFLKNSLTGELLNGSIRPEEIFSKLQLDIKSLAIWHSAFAAITAFIISRGVQRGIEKAIGIMMPLLFLILIVLAVFSGINGNFDQAFTFLFSPDFSKVTPRVIFMAVSQAFFTIGIGIGAVLVYGAYLGKGVNLIRTTSIILIADTAVALLAGLVVFPIVFSQGLDPAQGPGLVFVTLPLAFSKIPGGHLVAIGFFALFSMAALTSAIALLAPLVRLLEEKGIKKEVGSWAIAGFAWALGFVTILSFNEWEAFYPLSFIGFFKTANIYQIVETISAGILLLVNGVGFSIFVGWVLSKKDHLEGIETKNQHLYRIWLFCVKYLAPVFVSAVLITTFL